MNFFSMKGAWGGFATMVYNAVVVPALRKIYSSAIDEYLASGFIRAGMKVIDSGCGPGHLLSLLAAKFPETEFTGIDLSQHMTARAKKETARYPNVSVIAADALNLPFDGSTFDTAISMASIKHWPDPLKGVQEMYRVLKPGGRVMIMEANRHSTRTASWNFVKLWRFSPYPVKFLLLPYFIKFVVKQSMSAEELESLCLKAGFSEVKSAERSDFPGAIVFGMKPFFSSCKP